MMRMLVAVFAIGCTHEPVEPVGLAPLRTLETEHLIVGVDSDDAGGVWVATRTPIAPFDEIVIVHVDANGVEDNRLVIRTEDSEVRGIAFSGLLWLNHAEGNLYMRAVDPVTGAQVRSYALPLGIVDLEAYENTLVLSNLWNKIITLDRATGGLISRVEVPTIGRSLQRGIAVTADATWLADWESNLYRIDKSGSVDAFVPQGFENMSVGWGGSYLAVDRDQVIVANNRRISWYAP